MALSIKHQEVAQLSAKLSTPEPLYIMAIKVASSSPVLQVSIQTLGGEGLVNEDHTLEGSGATK